MWKKELRFLLAAGFIFLFFYFLPFDQRVIVGLKEAVYLTHEYAREHVIFCLLPALFIAGAISTFLSEASVMKYLGAQAPKHVSYSVASVSGAILAVCSCTVLPIFAGIYFRGAGIGPATTFLYSGPAINILAIVLTAKILGLNIGIARAIGAILGSILIGLLMAYLFRKEEKIRLGEMELTEEPETIPFYQRVTLLATLVGILILATWGGKTGIAGIIFSLKWYLVSFLVLLLGVEVVFWFGVSATMLLITALLVGLTQVVFHEKEITFLVGLIGFSYALYKTKGEMEKWFQNTYLLGKQILPLLLAGVFVAGFFLGRPGHEAFLPSSYIASLVGGNSLWANFFASLVGVLMYFATLTEVPIVQGLLGSGMGYGPALALLLAGPSVSLPSLLVLKSIWRVKKTLVYGGLVIVLSTILGYIFGFITR
ncbi:hypothetical protein F1847_04880 [Thermodesulfobacterium sp. TA1]|uniref:permease n=1 Tax=Thermodesulfobacterium sp. TA1 TaxID=2234087 RepID=UPI00123188FE|nr:permease [Thermodesulfobacterium sp. TA1]QER42110.1 hypothetical protein F1847_04880 [Thermodesulfobacterium sp. TA1]